MTAPTITTPATTLSFIIILLKNFALSGGGEGGEGINLSGVESCGGLDPSGVGACEGGNTVDIDPSGIGACEGPDPSSNVVKW